MHWLQELADDARLRDRQCGTVLPDWTVTRRELSAGVLHLPKRRRLHVKRKLRRRRKVQR